MNTQELVKALEDERMNKTTERAHSLAYRLSKIVIRKANDLELERVYSKTRTYFVEEINSSVGGYTTVLVDLDTDKKECIGRDSYYLNGDYSCWIEGATRKTNINFLKGFREIIEYLAEMQKKLQEGADKAIQDAEAVLKSLEQED